MADFQMKSPIAALVAISLTSCSGTSEEEMIKTGKECMAFVEKNIKSRQTIETKIFDLYEKKGNLVAQIGYRDKFTNDSYSVRLCVVDSERQTISLPSPLNDSEWKK